MLCDKASHGEIPIRVLHGARCCLRINPFELGGAAAIVLQLSERARARSEQLRSKYVASGGEFLVKLAADDAAQVVRAMA